MASSPRIPQPRSPFDGAVARVPELTCPYCCQRLELSNTGVHLKPGFRVERSPEEGACESPLIGVCRGCRVAFDDVTAQPLVHEEVRHGVLLAIYRTRRARDIFDCRRGNVSEAMSELAEAFVWLDGKPGVRPFSAHELHAWACGTALSACQRDSIAFVLHVHDATARWDVCFDVAGALQRWDPTQRAVFVEWAQRPWWA
jgi:hypothetical protein